MNRELVAKQYLDVSSFINFNEAFEYIKASKECYVGQEEIVINFGNLVLTQGHIKYVELYLKDQQVRLKEIHSSHVNTQLAVLSCGISVSDKQDTDDVEMIVNKIEEDMILSFNPEPTILETIEESFEGTTEDDLEEEFIEKVLDTREYKTTTVALVPTKTPLMSSQIGKLTDALYVKQTLRSGQVVKHHSDIVILGDVHPGSEVISEGDIIVWGVLGGLAHAGASGNKKAEIRALRIDAIQLRIAQYFARCPDHTKVEKTVRVELARVEDDMIKIYKL